MPQNVTHKLIAAHLVEGVARPSAEIALRVDQTLTQDATGTLVMLELERMGVARVRTELSVQYVDHNLLQEDFKNGDDHLFLHSAARRFGIWFSRPGNGVSHPVHMEHFGRPGASLLGSDSHTCAAGALGMLAIGAGGLEVALAMAGRPFFVTMPEVWGVTLHGKLPDWVSAKDVILELLRRHGVAGGLGRVLEYRGPGLEQLDVWDRHVIANMGAELGATTSVFPADHRVRSFLAAQGRADAFAEILADPGASYDVEEEIDLGRLQPLIAKPSSPGNVVPVAEVAGEEIHQAYIGSSANPGFRDFAIAAQIVAGAQVPAQVSLDINPSTRSVLSALAAEGLLTRLLDAGARLHQTGCNGCIGMGQAPASGRNSLRTVPRNFPGRSGTHDDRVWLCSPETAAASALQGRITDPRTLGKPYPVARASGEPARARRLLLAPLQAEAAGRVELVRGPNIRPLPRHDALPDSLVVPVLLKLGDDVSTDEILPAGARVLPFRSNIERIADFCFEGLDPGYAQRARRIGAHAIVAGANYGQGSSREHAALATRHLGLRAVLAKSFARIHFQNLINFGVLPLRFSSPADYDQIASAQGTLQLAGLHTALRRGGVLHAQIDGSLVELRHDMSPRQVEIAIAGGLLRVEASARARAAAG